MEQAVKIPIVVKDFSVDKVRLTALIKQDLNGEESTAKQYEIRIEQAKKLGFVDWAEVIEEILADEKDHAKKLKSILEDK